MSRLIDAEDFERVVKEYCKDLIDHNKHTMDVVDFNADIQGLLDNQPTAFDVDKVVEQLELLKDKALKRREELIEINSYNNIILKNIEYERGREYAFDDAIEIVKEGGKCKTNMCIDCSMATYSQGRPYCEKEERHLDSFSYKPDWCLLKAGGIDD